MNKPLDSEQIIQLLREQQWYYDKKIQYLEAEIVSLKAKIVCQDKEEE